MDHVVHINDGSEATKPIVLRLLPGEETIFNLKIVNHGEPSNISLEASDPVIKALRLKKPDHYVVLEETVPVLARMPANRKRLDGELLLTSSAGKSSVPITLVREPEDPGEDLDEPEIGYRENEDLKDRVNDDADAEDDLDSEADEDEEGQDSEADASLADEDLAEAEGEAEEHDSVRPIRFTRQRDLHSYKSASKSVVRSAPGFFAEEHEAGEGADEAKAAGLERGFGEERIPERQPDLREGRQHGEEKPGYGGSEYAGESGSYKPYQEEEEEDEASVEDDEGGILNLFVQRGSLQIVPAIILITLIAVLILTFLTESLPEFPGALASSILIVTLIIYGAATLLKA